jgi:hypothetical protein
MSRRSTVTEAQIRRAMKVAREIDPSAVVEVTHDGIIRILPQQPRESAKNEVDLYFDGQD